jgi:hypothetical protein
MKWYYSFNNTIYGPVDEVKLLKLCKDEVVEPTTMVHPEGVTEWISFEKAGILPSSKKENVKPEELKSTFVWFVILFIFVATELFFDRFIYPIGISGTSGFQSFLVTVRCLILIPTCIGGILTCILHYQCWKAIQNERSTVTPGKAVGLLFIPIYHFYWVFKSYWGFSKQANAYARRLKLDNPEIEIRLSKEWLSLLYSLICSLGFVVFVIVYQFIRASTPAIVEVTSFSSTAQYFSIMKPYLFLLAIQYLLYLITELTTMIDFYLTAKSILIAEKQIENEVN